VTFLSILGIKTLEGNSSWSKKERKNQSGILELIEPHLQEEAPQPLIYTKNWLNLEEELSDFVKNDVGGHNDGVKGWERPL
jgi:hypothetical protein